MATHLDSFKTQLDQKSQELLNPFQWVIQFEQINSREGLFYPPGTYPDARLQNSNQLMIVLSPSILENPHMLQLLTHELFHAVHYLINPQELAWVREGLAQLFEYQAHRRFHYESVLLALKDSSTALEGQYDIEAPSQEQYGHNFLYFYFLQTKCFPQHPHYIWQLASRKSEKPDQGIGREGIDLFLKSLKSARKMCQSFKASAESFVVARALNQYSGLEQNDETFIMDFSAPATIDQGIASELVSLSSAHWVKLSKELPAYFPLYLGTDQFIESRGPKNWAALSAAHVQVVFIQSAFPFAVQAMVPGRPFIIPPSSFDKALIFKSL